MIKRFKAALVLLAIAVVWLGLIFFTWRGWVQLLVTIACWVTKNPDLEAYNYGLWIAQDQDVNAIFLGNPDETISSRIGVAALLGSTTAIYMSYVVDFMFYVSVGQTDHCVASIEMDEQKLRARKMIEAAFEKRSLEVEGA